MFDEANRQRLFVVYDGIENSVFQSQVMQPLLKELDENPGLEVTIVSFEKKGMKNKKLIQAIPAHEKLHFIVSERLPYVGTLSLWFATLQLKRLLKRIPVTEIIARGPLAGFVAIKALRWWAKQLPKAQQELVDYFPSLTVQARGLCAEEYRYAHQDEAPHFFLSWWRHYIFKSLEKIERIVFKKKRQGDCPVPVMIESVSPALRSYLIDHFEADPTKMSIATRDMPGDVTKDQIAQWRHEIRSKLNISQEAIVYCYSGSWRPWQCVDQTIEYFANAYANNPNAYLLILSQDVEKFAKELRAYKIPAENHKIVSVKPTELNQYLAAADFGLLFRKQDVINWVSRPTKMLEYKSVGLEIIHNKTISWLT